MEEEKIIGRRRTDIFSGCDIELGALVECECNYRHEILPHLTEPTVTGTPKVTFAGYITNISETGITLGMAARHYRISTSEDYKERYISYNPEMYIPYTDIEKGRILRRGPV